MIIVIVITVRLIIVIIVNACVGSGGESLRGPGGAGYCHCRRPEIGRAEPRDLGFRGLGFRELNHPQRRLS